MHQTQGVKYFIAQTLYCCLQEAANTTRSALYKAAANDHTAMNSSTPPGPVSPGSLAPEVKTTTSDGGATVMSQQTLFRLQCSVQHGVAHHCDVLISLSSRILPAG